MTAKHKLGYGKFGENLLKQFDVALVTNLDDFRRQLMNPFYKSHSIGKEHLQISKSKKVWNFLDLSGGRLVLRSICKISDF